MNDLSGALLRRRHEAHIAKLMGDALLLMMYQSESAHPAHELQTKLVTLLGQARDVAVSLANALDPDKPEPLPASHALIDEILSMVSTPNPIPGWRAAIDRNIIRDVLAALDVVQSSRYPEPKMSTEDYRAVFGSNQIKPPKV